MNHPASDSAENSQHKPWQALYPSGLLQATPVRSQALNLATAWKNRVDAAPDAPALMYFDAVFSARQVDALSDALAVALAEQGVQAGDRIGVHLQNIPQYALLLIALWKLGAAALLLNPMYMGDELKALVGDAGARGIIATDCDVDRVRSSVAGTSVQWVIGTDERALQTRNDPRVFVDEAPAMPASSADDDLMALLQAHQGQRPPATPADADTLALLVYTSGTTGPAKGAMVSHANVLAVTGSFARFADIRPGDVTFALAPLFHITGAVVLGALALMEGTALVCTGRFQPEVVLDALQEHQATYMVGSITAYIALMNSPAAKREHFASMRTLFSGGAPVPPSTVQEFQDRFGHYVHNAYGMTETSSAVMAVPPGTQAPVEPGSGTLSVGVPLPGVYAEVVGPDDRSLPAGQQGELVMSGPQIVSGYWKQPEASAQAMPGGRLHSGDAAVMDEQGWVYLVDRLKDQINVSGYKVWPREVEDCLYQHPAVLEAAVVGVPDDYQGESVVAYVSLRSGERTEAEELKTFVSARLAAYKRPRAVHIVTDLPKTQTGKIRRNELRQLASATENQADAMGPTGRQVRQDIAPE